MMPVKDILAMRPREPGSPIIIIDESSIEGTCDAGPVCGCQEKYNMIQKYRPFVPGGVHPYKRRTIPDDKCYAITWKNIKIGSSDLLMEKPFAQHACELPPDYKWQKEDLQDQMYVTPPRYTQEYYKKKLNECPREHYIGCDCFDPKESEA